MITLTTGFVTQFPEFMWIFMGFFFTVWNFMLSLFFVGPMWVRFFKDPTVRHLTGALMTLALPHVVVGFVVPLVLGPCPL